MPRAALGIPDAADILLGNGSDELIQIIIMALARPGAVVLAPEPTFVMYRLIARWLGVEFVGVPLRSGDFGLDRAALLAAIARHRPAAVFLAYPNNPTGNLFARDDVVAVLDAAPGVVVVDEAYAPFASDSFMAQAGAAANLLVMRTLSKAGLAGLRLGVLAGPAEWIAQFDKVRLPYNIGSLTQITAGRTASPRVMAASDRGDLRGARAARGRARRADRGSGVSVGRQFPAVPGSRWLGTRAVPEAAGGRGPHQASRWHASGAERLSAGHRRPAGGERAVAGSADAGPRRRGAQVGNGWPEV